MSDERKCQAGCGDPESSHVAQEITLAAHCIDCRNRGLLRNAFHSFETIESLRAEVDEKDAMLVELNGMVGDFAEEHNQIADAIGYESDSRQTLAEAVAALTAERDELRGLIEASDAGPLFEKMDWQHRRIAELEHELNVSRDLYPLRQLVLTDEALVELEETLRDEFSRWSEHASRHFRVQRTMSAIRAARRKE